MRARLEQYFQFQELGTNWRTEILAGVTTFVTMAYIIFVNPSILHETGMPATAVTAATCLAAAIGCLLMGIVARYPIALAPGMGLNAYFTYTVCLGMHVPWQVALGAVFLSGIIFLLLTALGIRQLILESIPRELYAAVAVGIGLFIAFIGFRNAGIIKADPATLVSLGNLRDPGTLVALFGLILIAGLMTWGVRAAMLIGILATTLLGALTGLVRWNPQAYSPADLSATFFQLDLAGTMKLGLLEIVFVFLFVDLFDNIGTLVAVGTRAGLFDRDGHIPRVNRILTADAIASTAGALCGTSTVVSYIESAAGVVAGGRSGFTAVVCGLLFLVALFIAPLFGVIPAQATAPALIIVGALMLTHTEDIEWNKPVVAIPAFLTLAAIPLTFSIANGLAFGFTSHTLLRVIAGEWRKVNWLVYVLTALFLLRFFYLGKG
ncbi:NCS2 family permease [Paludibaculum fermentans]|uniref:NCS2 family permease n=1 Tax=Paludibaculum fermentans TaxID=1473598 RepID=A0A7S7NMI3_PALFE|nr:NCS2 family permease [Paludibaculum fermentans]QOY86338.1 NCS2 family permease [Paludibaculum fermentans]